MSGKANEAEDDEVETIAVEMASETGDTHQRRAMATRAIGLALGIAAEAMVLCTEEGSDLAGRDGRRCSIIQWANAEHDEAVAGILVRNEASRKLCNNKSADNRVKKGGKLGAGSWWKVATEEGPTPREPLDTSGARGGAGRATERGSRKTARSRRRARAWGSEGRSGVQERRWGRR